MQDDKADHVGSMPDLDTSLFFLCILSFFLRAGLNTYPLSQLHSARECTPLVTVIVNDTQAYYYIDA